MLESGASGRLLESAGSGSSPIWCWPDPWASPGREDRWGRSGIIALMALLPPKKSPWWLLVFVVTALLWTAVLLGAGYFNSGQLPPWPTMWTALGVVSGATGLLALLAFLGLRATFAGAHIGLASGLVWMVAQFAGPSDGWADLAAFAGFLMLGAIGLGVGLLVDLVLFLRRR
jgi:hypothetical protein